MDNDDDDDVNDCDLGGERYRRHCPVRSVNVVIFICITSTMVAVEADHSLTTPMVKRLFILIRTLESRKHWMMGRVIWWNCQRETTVPSCFKKWKVMHCVPDAVKYSEAHKKVSSFVMNISQVL